MTTVVLVKDADGRLLTVLHKNGLVGTTEDGKTTMLSAAYEEIANYLLINDLPAAEVQYADCVVIGKKWALAKIDTVELTRHMTTLNESVMKFEGPDEWNVVARVKRGDARAWLTKLIAQKLRERKQRGLYHLYDFIDEHAAPGYPYVARLYCPEWSLYVEDVWKQAVSEKNEVRPPPRLWQRLWQRLWPSRCK